VTLFTDKRNLVVASYNVLSAVGRLNAVELKLNSNIYDETAHYDEVKRKITGMSINYSDGQPETASPADAKKGGNGRINAANLRPTVTRPSDLNVAPLPKPTAAPGAATGGAPIAIVPPGRAVRKPAPPPTPAGAMPLSPPLSPAVPPAPAAPVNPNAPMPISPPAGAVPKSGQNAPQQLQKAAERAPLRGSIDNGWTATTQ